MKPLFIDIETAAEFKNLPKSKEKLFCYKNRDKVSGTPLPVNEAKELYKSRAALSPITGKIVCISVGIMDGDKLRMIALTGDERKLIKEFYKIAQDKFTIVVHNKQFDLPFIRVRAMKHGVTIPTHLNDSFCKPWDVGLEPRAKVKVYDTMDAIKGIGYNNYSLDEVCDVLGVKSPKDGIGGADVSSEYYKGNLETIVEYCNKDVFAMSQCYHVLTGENIDYTMLVVKAPEVKTYTNSLTEIFETGESSLVGDDMGKLSTNKDKEIFNTLLKAAKNVED
jgi:predicted PolB exonuclease-like 3'-5' exonuclease